MSVREWITKKVATGIMIPENIVRLVISHQFDSAYEALENNNSVEISGFGKFYYNTKKAEKEIKNFKAHQDTYRRALEEATSDIERSEAIEKLRWATKKLETIQNKLEKNGKS